MAAFTLHSQLKADTFFISDQKLCRVLLMNNRHFPWLILVPRVKAAREIIDLSPAQRQLLMEEIALISQIMQRQFSPHKLNVAALGNQVEQLHIHIIARFPVDNAWPNPVWGSVSAPYEDASPVIGQLRSALS